MLTDDAKAIADCLLNEKDASKWSAGIQNAADFLLRLSAAEPTDAELTAAWNEGTFPIHDDLGKTVREAFIAGYRLHRARTGNGSLVEAIAALIESDLYIEPQKVSVEAYRKAHIILGLTAPQPAASPVEEPKS